MLVRFIPVFTPKAPHHYNRHTHTMPGVKKPTTRNDGRLRVNFTLAQLQPHFHKTQRQTAATLGVSVSSLKRNCRRVGLDSWPWRRMRSLEKKKRHDIATVIATELGRARAPTGDTPAAAVRPEIASPTLWGEYRCASPTSVDAFPPSRRQPHRHRYPHFMAMHAATPSSRLVLPPLRHQQQRLPSIAELLLQLQHRASQSVAVAPCPRQTQAAQCCYRYHSCCCPGAVSNTWRPTTSESETDEGAADMSQVRSEGKIDSNTNSDL